MTRICSFFLVFFILTSISYAQLLEGQQKRNIFDKHTHFKYYDEIVKKETGRTLNQLAHDSKTSLAKGFSISFSETELQAINMVLTKHKKNRLQRFRSKTPYLSIKWIPKYYIYTLERKG